MGFSARHPRYTIALVVLLFISVLFFANSDSPPSLSRFRQNHGNHRPPTPNVEDQIKLSESYYQETLKERQQLIAHWGPSSSQVEGFPTHGEYYTLWNYFPAAFQCPHRIRRIGTLGDGGKWICGLERITAKKDCVIYSVGELRYLANSCFTSSKLSIFTGINGESSFEASLLENVPGCQVYGYDYSVKSVCAIHLLQCIPG